MDNRKISKNKKIVFIITLIAIVLLAIAALLLLKKNTNVESKNDKTDNNLDQMIADISELNLLFAEGTLLPEGTYEKNDKTCFEYIGKEKVDIIINKAKELFHNPFGPTSDFQIINSTFQDGTAKEKLYVCLNINCVADSITDYEIIKESETDIYKELRIDSNYIIKMSKINDTWKFDEPVVICK